MACSHSAGTADFTSCAAALTRVEVLLMASAATKLLRAYATTCPRRHGRPTLAAEDAAATVPGWQRCSTSPDPLGWHVASRVTHRKRRVNLCWMPSARARGGSAPGGAALARALVWLPPTAAAIPVRAKGGGGVASYGVLFDSPGLGEHGQCRVHLSAHALRAREGRGGAARRSLRALGLRRLPSGIRVGDRRRPYRFSFSLRGGGWLSLSRHGSRGMALGRWQLRLRRRRELRSTACFRTSTAIFQRGPMSATHHSPITRRLRNRAARFSSSSGSSTLLTAGMF